MTFKKLQVPTILLISVIIFLSCQKEEEILPVVNPPVVEEPLVELKVEFSQDTTALIEGGQINFQDKSSGVPTKWQWTFEGGEPATSTEKNPTVKYLTAGSYDVSLKIFRDDLQDEIVKSDFIVVNRAISSAKELTSFSFDRGVNDIIVPGDGIIENKIVSVFLPPGTKKDALIPTFSISDKAKVYVNEVEIQSGISELDFSEGKLILEIVAEDETSVEYEINLTTDFPEIDNRVLTWMNSMNIPGAQVAITKNERLVYSKSYGLADVENNVPVTESSLFRIASLSKPITQTAILYLVQSGKISLDDKVFGENALLKTTYGTNPYSDQIKAITVRHLVEHKAGGWTNDNQDPTFLPNSWTQTEIINYVLDNRPLQFEPGTTYLYSNVGYLLLGRIIEAVSGETYEAFVKKTLLIPSGIINMQIGNGSLEGRFPNEVKYYQPSANPYAYNTSRRDSHGGWIASAEDMVKFLARIDRNLGVSDLVEESFLNETYFKFINWFHSGSFPGTATLLERVNNEISYTILANGNGASYSLTGQEMRKAVREGVLERQKWPEYDLMDK